MRCAQTGCGAATRVIDSRVAPGNKWRRRRECAAGHRFTTYEIAEGDLPASVPVIELENLRAAVNGAVLRVIRKAGNGGAA